MQRIEDIKKFEDIDTYYEISDIVAEVFQDRVEAHKHLVTANKEIERLNNIIKHTDSWIDRTIEIIKQQPSEDDTWILERLNSIKHCLKGSDK